MSGDVMGHGDRLGVLQWRDPVHGRSGNAELYIIENAAVRTGKSLNTAERRAVGIYPA